MANDNDNIKNYTAADISRYWEGKLSPQEMHAMEKAAMDDPFLADAMEGYAGAAPASIAGGVQELKDRLHARVRREDGKAGPFIIGKWWRIAALFIILFGMGGLAYQLFLKTGEPTKDITAIPQKTETANSRRDSFNPQKNAGEVANAFKDTSAAAANNAIVLQPVVPPRYQQPPAAGTEKALKAPVNAADTLTGSSLAGATADKSNDAARNAATALKKDQQAVADSLYIAANTNKEAERRAMNARPEDSNFARQAPSNQQQPDRTGNVTIFNNFSGRVLDRNNNAIPNASVRISNSNQAIVTTNDGYFNLRSYDTIMDVAVSSVGYESRQFRIRGNQPENIILDDQSGKYLKEVVVTGTGNRKKSSTASELKVYPMEAAPVIGWEEYNKYLSENKKAGEAYRSLKGDVVISFWVSKGGKLSAFDIEKSLGKQADAEAIRLIKEGPAWKLLKGRKTKARVVVNF